MSMQTYPQKHDAQFESFVIVPPGLSEKIVRVPPVVRKNRPPSIWLKLAGNLYRSSKNIVWKYEQNRPDGFPSRGRQNVAGGVGDPFTGS